MNTFRSIAMLLCAVALTACEKNGVQDITGSLPGARIKFFNFGVNTPAVNFYANDSKITAITSATGVEAVTGVNSGGVGSGGFYSAVQPGAYTFTGKIAAVVDKDLVVSRATATLVDGKAYSFYISGIYNVTAKTAEAFVVEDTFVDTLDYTVAYVRFVNAISNANPMTLYATNPTTGVELPVGSAVAYKSAGAFTALPSAVYDLRTRYAGSATNVITRTAVSFVAGKVYTIGARGDITVTSTTLATRPQLDNTANR
ncbi:MAG: hypothetical protein P3C10_04780 [Gemmatimonadota bacterium]|nr:hypothetical protein [Gemmatimonadota bacterium]